MSHASGINASLYSNLSYNNKISHTEKETLLDFLQKNDFGERTESAINAIGVLFHDHGKSSARGYLEVLNVIEETSKNEYLRDHVTHAVMTYILGRCIYFHAKDHIGFIDDVTFKIAFLLHDIAYGYELDNDTMKKSEIIDKIREFELILPTQKSLLRQTQPMLILGNYIKKNGINKNAGEIYGEMLNSGRPCHGIIGGIVLLRYIMDLYLRHNPNKIMETDGNPNWSWKNINDYIVPACSAIFIHNTNDTQLFRHKISPMSSPEVYLLKLCDTLQEWWRPGKFRHQSEPSDFNISFESDGKIIFYAKNTDTLSKIRKDLSILESDLFDLQPLIS